MICQIERVALRMESVGRNAVFIRPIKRYRVSLSAWRAWVEIGSSGNPSCQVIVALRMESVGRNPIAGYYRRVHGCPSLSAWRAWVEMCNLFHFIRIEFVALRMESVGRNHFGADPAHCLRASLSAWRAWVEMRKLRLRLRKRLRRSPHGERG